MNERVTTGLSRCGKSTEERKRTEDKLMNGMSIYGIFRYLRTGVLLSRVILFGRFLSTRVRSHLISGNELGLGGRHHEIMNLTRSSAAVELKADFDLL